MERRIEGMELHLHAIASDGQNNNNLSSGAPAARPAPTAVMVGPCTPPYDSDSSDDAVFKTNQPSPARSSTPHGPHDRYVRTNSNDSGESYYGPGSLVDLCHDFQISVRDSIKAQRDLHSASIDPQNRHYQDIDSRLEQLCREASDDGNLVEESSISTSEDLVTALPPKPVVLAAASQFFQQVDFVTDIFDETTFRANLDHVYSEPFADPPWAICCRVVILLVCATELVTSGSQSLLGGLARPYLTDGLSAVAYRRLGTTPRLINVQTLILLVSHAP